jgi:hypothetical protein
VRTRSAHHIKLEGEINTLKQAIYQYSSNCSNVTELRKQATQLIKGLTFEIRREIIEEEKLRKFN